MFLGNINRKLLQAITKVIRGR